MMTQTIFIRALFAFSMVLIHEGAGSEAQLQQRLIAVGNQANKGAEQSSTWAANPNKRIPISETGGRKTVPSRLSPPLDMEGFVFIQGGCFEMGDSYGDGNNDEKPIHQVCVSNFYLGQYEVTVGEFRAFVKDTGYKTDAEKRDGCYFWMGRAWGKDKNLMWSRPGFPQTDEHPVVCITWHDANEYASWRNKNTGIPYRLPTEAEWEYAARNGGKRQKWIGTNVESEIGTYSWYWSNSGKRTHPVGQKKPNGLGLYDMGGNAWEWLNDWYEADYYRHSARNNPKGPPSGKGKVIRGGSWYVIPRSIRATYRNWSIPDKRHYNSFGFRLSVSIE